MINQSGGPKIYWPNTRATGLLNRELNTRQKSNVASTLFCIEIDLRQNMVKVSGSLLQTQTMTRKMYFPNFQPFTGGNNLHSVTTLSRSDAMR